MTDASSSPHFADSIAAAVGEMLAKSDRGGKLPIVTVTIEEPLTPAHIAAYAESHGKLDTTEKSDEKDVNVLRARHHGVARLLAAGLPNNIVAELTNFDAGYISVLKNNPSMIQLVAFYRAPGNAAAEALTERLRTAASGALERLLSKLENGELSAQEELALAKLGFDRSGHGPQSQVHTINEHHDIAEIARLQASARQADAQRTHNINDMRRALPAPPAKDDGDAEAS